MALFGNYRTVSVMVQERVMFVLEFAGLLVSCGEEFAFLKKVYKKYACIGKRLCFILKLFFIYLVLYNF